MDKTVQDVLDRQSRMADTRRGWESHWQELAEYLLPRRADFTHSQSPGGKRTEKQFDATPMQAARALAAALDGLLKPKTQRWFSIRADDAALNDDQEAKLWLRAAEDQLFSAFYDTSSRFLQRSAEVDLDLVVFGTGVLFVGERTNADGLLFQSLHLRDCYIAENADGEIDTCFRRLRLTARQAEQRFGRNALGEKTREALGRDQSDEMFEFIQAVMPRTERERARADAANMAFASVTIDVASEHLIGTSGFQDFPFVIPRWDTASGEVYGRSPGMLALPDVKTLNQMGKTILEAGHKIVNPPLLVPNDGIGSNPRTFPGGITPFDAGLLLQTGGRPPITPLYTGGNVPIGREMQNDMRSQIWSAFFRNVLQLPFDGPQMTATEILERKAEFMRVIGPTLGRLETDYTGPMVERAFKLLLRAGRLPEPPDSLRGSGVHFEYASPIAKAQKQIDAAALSKTVADIGLLAAQNPAILDNFDDDLVAREIAEANGLPQHWIRPTEEVERIRAERRAAAEAAALGQEMAGAASAIGTLGGVDEVQKLLNGGPLVATEG
jgi:hypothetical protein